METLKPTETLERHISQKGITIGPQKLEIFKRALALRGTWVIHSQENTEDPTVFVKLSTPDQDQEFGYVDLAELSEVPGALGIGIEVDVWFLPQPLSEAIRSEERRVG